MGLSKDLPSGRTTVDDSDLFEVVRNVRKGITRQSTTVAVRSALTQLIAKGATITWREIAALSQAFPRSGAYPIPPYLVDFLTEAMAARTDQRLLDPWSRFGVLASSLTEVGIAGTTTEIVQSEAEARVVRLIAGERATDLRVGLTRQEIEAMGVHFDLVVSAPPPAMKTAIHRVGTDTGSAQIRDTSTHMLMLSALRLLADDGNAVLLLPDSFFRQKDGVRAHLGMFGFHINSVITLPDSTFSLGGHGSGNLVFISRDPDDLIFVAKLSAEVDYEPLIKNMRLRRQGATPELGIMTDSVTFTSFRHYVATERLSELASDMALNATPMSEAFTAINRPGQNGFRETPNAVYLPLTPHATVALRMSDFEGGPDSYVQLVPRPEVVLPAFLVKLLNAPVGRLVREIWDTDTVGSRGDLSQLWDATIFLPALATQTHALQVNQTLAEVRFQLDELSDRLWRQPSSAPSIGRAVQRLSAAEGFESWIDRMPFPLASVLWSYRATSDEHDRLEHLLHFFEAGAEFFCCVLLSAMQSENKLFDETRARLLKSVRGSAGMQQSTFGYWSKLAQQLARNYRTMLSGDEFERCFSLFRTGNRQVAEALSSKRLYGVFTEVSGLRNEWTGHGGFARKEETQRRISQLESLPVPVREITAVAFGGLTLLRPRSNQFHSGLYRHTVQFLTGARTPFPENEIELTVPLDDKRLYLHDPDEKESLELIPLIRMMSGAEGEGSACFFYNRIAGDTIRWVSYHVSDEADRTHPDADLAEFVARWEDRN